jgi:hypothetical protein
MEIVFPSLLLIPTLSAKTAKKKKRKKEKQLSDIVSGSGTFTSVVLMEKLMSCKYTVYY